MYDQTAQASGRRTGSQSSRQRGPRRSVQRRRESGQDRLRLIQLLICLVLFLVVFVGKGIFPDKMVQVKDELLGLITANTDFRAALSHLGGSLTGSGTVLDDFGEFCVEVFGGRREEEVPARPTAAVQVPVQDTLEEELGFLSAVPDRQTAAYHYWREEGSAKILPALRQGPTEQEPEAPAVSAPPAGIPEAVPAAGTVVAYSDYDGEPLPERYTMDQVSLGDLVTTDPIVGRLTSPYGYRDHPITGEHDFHGGTDISGNIGDPIGAFADGVVEYIGKNDSYGLYLQIDHGNGIKSFYAHCSKLCVSKGQEVSLGEKVAEVGATGVATGPHLHLELKYNKMHLDPAYYVSFVSVV